MTGPFDDVTASRDCCAPADPLTWGIRTTHARGGRRAALYLITQCLRRTSGSCISVEVELDAASRCDAQPRGGRTAAAVRPIEIVHPERQHDFPCRAVQPIRVSQLDDVVAFGDGDAVAGDVIHPPRSLDVAFDSARNGGALIVEIHLGRPAGVEEPAVRTKVQGRGFGRRAASSHHHGTRALEHDNGLGRRIDGVTNARDDRAPRFRVGIRHVTRQAGDHPLCLRHGRQGHGGCQYRGQDRQGFT